mmetsp:Transcript_21953/g.68100  ORF Transcript_21953/g.68100 Transcript_21953/m.68100 type:complete len:252 (+) Transcript_21953:2836-3591(+)
MRLKPTRTPDWSPMKKSALPDTGNEADDMPSAVRTMDGYTGANVQMKRRAGKPQPDMPALWSTKPASSMAWTGTMRQSFIATMRAARPTPWAICSVDSVASGPGRRCVAIVKTRIGNVLPPTETVHVSHGALNDRRWICELLNTQAVLDRRPPSPLVDTVTEKLGLAAVATVVAGATPATGIVAASSEPVDQSAMAMSLPASMLRGTKPTSVVIDAAVVTTKVDGSWKLVAEPVPILYVTTMWHVAHVRVK